MEVGRWKMNSFVLDLTDVTDRKNEKASSYRVLVIAEPPIFRARLLYRANTKMLVVKLMIHSWQLTIYKYFRLIPLRFELYRVLSIDRAKIGS